jgi:hypothetical protein
MPAIIQWDKQSAAFRKLESYLQGHFTCQRCGNTTTLWQPMCLWCGGGVYRPLPRVSAKHKVNFTATELLEAIADMSEWRPGQLTALGVEALIEPFGNDRLIYLRDMQSFLPTAPWHIQVDSDSSGYPLVFGDDAWGHLPMLRVNVPAMEAVVPLDAQLTLTLHPFKTITQEIWQKAVLR